MELANLNLETSEPLSLVQQAQRRMYHRYVALLAFLLATSMLCLYLVFRGPPAALAELRVIDHSSAQPGSAEAMARCLDGSEYVYYVRPGHGTGKSKWLIFLDGGDVCVSLDDCMEHARGKASSEHWKRTPVLDLAEQHHTFSTSAAENPLMWNWNWIFLVNCDAGYYSGQSLRPLTTDSEPSQLFFRGWYNVKATFEQLNRASDLNGGLAEATDVLIAGCSAGTVGTFLHLDSLRSRLPESTKVRGYGSSGFFLATPKYLPLKQFIWSEMNVSCSLNPSCLGTHEGAEWACLAGSNAAGYVQTPLFLVQGLYDSVQLTESAPRHCLWSFSCANEYGSSVRHQMTQWLAASRNRGLFLHSCISHCGRDVMTVDGLTPLQALRNWWELENVTVNLTQFAHYPCLTCCLGSLWAAPTSDSAQLESSSAYSAKSLPF